MSEVTHVIKERSLEVRISLELDTVLERGAQIMGA